MSTDPLAAETRTPFGSPASRGSIPPPKPKKVLSQADRLLELAESEGWELKRVHGFPKSNDWARVFAKPDRVIHLQFFRGLITGAVVFMHPHRGRPLVWNHDHEQRAAMFLRGVPCTCAPNTFMEDVAVSETCGIHGVAEEEEA